MYWLREGRGRAKGKWLKGREDEDKRVTCIYVMHEFCSFDEWISTRGLDTLSLSTYSLQTVLV